ncbi:MAG: phytanoyl-CoA dioxygenase family protein [Pseudomonadota bacterium]
MNYSSEIWLTAEAGAFETFKQQVSQVTDLRRWPMAAAVEQNVLIYDGGFVRSVAADDGKRRDLMAEWASALANGPGVIAIKGAMDDLDAVDEATALFDEIIEEEKAAGAGAGDHFAKPGANDRIWNALEKHCLKDPANFAAYYAADALAMASEAWLGLGYQMTAQVNRVNPGGKAQTPHRDYHLGFMSAEQIAAYPSQIHRISPLLTLQGAVAHCDMPLETGPTLLLPYSQLFFEGYLAFSRPEFQAYFAENHSQLPLDKGDAVFFNPALMHGAGDNVTEDRQRMANLLQVSSAFGRAMESVNRSAMVKALYPHLSGLSGTALANVIGASAEGYSFPTNLDSDPPVGGNAPKTQASRTAEAVASSMSAEEFGAAIDAADARRLP